MANGLQLETVQFCRLIFPFVLWLGVTRSHLEDLEDVLIRQINQQKKTVLHCNSHRMKPLLRSLVIVEQCFRLKVWINTSRIDTDSNTQLVPVTRTSHATQALLTYFYSAAYEVL